MITTPISVPISVDRYSAKALEEFWKSGLPKKFAAQTSKNSTEIILYDIIGSEETNAKTFNDALQQANGKDVTIRLSSPGGSVFEGITIYNSLKAYKGKSTVVVDGVCASIASVIALGADVVITQPNSLWMIHQAWCVSVGNGAELRQTADTLDKIDENLASIYAARSTNSDVQYWADKMKDETWYTSSEALAAGLVDHIAETSPKAMKNSKPSAMKLKQPVNVFDPDGDGDDDLAEALGSINSAIALLQDAVQALVPGQDDEDEGAVDQSAMALAKALRIRRALAASMLDK